MNKPLKYAAISLGIAAAIVALLYFNKQDAGAPSSSGSPSTSGTPRACTMEAKICPDGSAVGRVGPNCEFAPCPAPKKTATPMPTSTPLRY